MYPRLGTPDLKSTLSNERLPLSPWAWKEFFSQGSSGLFQMVTKRIFSRVGLQQRRWLLHASRSTCSRSESENITFSVTRKPLERSFGQALRRGAQKEQVKFHFTNFETKKEAKIEGT